MIFIVSTPHPFSMFTWTSLIFYHQTQCNKNHEKLAKKLGTWYGTFISKNCSKTYNLYLLNTHTNLYPKHPPLIKANFDTYFVIASSSLNLQPQIPFSNWISPPTLHWLTQKQPEVTTFSHHKCLASTLKSCHLDFMMNFFHMIHNHLKTFILLQVLNC
jgi:hypothetical protein